MKYLWASVLLVAGLPLFAGTQDSEFNVNTRYTVEDIHVASDGWTASLVSDHDTHISSGLKKDLAALIGQKLNPAALDELGRRLRKEFHARTVNHHVLRGKTPDAVQVFYDIQLRPARFDLAVPKFAYTSNQGWNGTGEATATVNHNSLTVGFASDGDELLERYTGFEARYENSRLGSDRLRFRFEFDTFHDLWSDNTRAAGPADIYRTRENVEPVLSFQVARPLSISFGASFEQMQMGGPRPAWKRPMHSSPAPVSIPGSKMKWIGMISIRVTISVRARARCPAISPITGTTWNFAILGHAANKW